jgi:hypothetical protein
MNHPTTAAKKLKDRLPGLEDVSMRTIQSHCLKKLKIL